MTTVQVLLMVVFMIVFYLALLFFTHEELPTEEEAREKVLTEYPECDPEDLVVNTYTKTIHMGGGSAWSIPTSHEIDVFYLENSSKDISVKITNPNMPDE